jgi:hypothetical protein
LSRKKVRVQLPAQATFAGRKRSFSHQTAQNNSDGFRKIKGQGGNFFSVPNLLKKGKS